MNLKIHESKPKSNSPLSGNDFSPKIEGTDEECSESYILKI